MKVLVVGSNSVHLSSYLKALSAEAIVPDFLAEEPCGFEGVREEIIVSFRRLNPLSIFAANRALRSALKRLCPDVVHIHQVNRLAYFVARQCKSLGIPVVTTAWGSDVLVIPEQNRFYRFLVRKTLERSQIVTADSLEMITAMQRLHAEPGKYVHLQYGIDLVSPGIKEKIVYSNRLHKKLYRIDRIVEYMEGFLQEYPDWKLVIGATGSETEALKEMVQQKRMTASVDFVGWLEKQANQDWYARSAIYISIPGHDGTAVSLLEAMSAGCVPVVPDLRVSHEWIEDGVNGVIEKEGKNPLLEAVKIDMEKCAAINRTKVEQKAGRDRCTKIFTEFYHTLSGAE